MRVLACEGSSGFLKTYRLRYRSCEMGEGEEVRVEPCGRTRSSRGPAATADEVAAFETDVLPGFVLARAAAGLSDGTIASDVMHLEQVRNLWSWSRRVVVDSSIRRVWAGRRRPVTTWSQLVVS